MYGKELANPQQKIKIIGNGFKL